jgi:hypothetical protein
MIIVHKPRTMNKILKKREEIEEEDSKTLSFIEKC